LTISRFTYAISFAALIATIRGIAEYWETPKFTQGGALFIAIPAAFIILQAFDIQVI
jgi:hypothetical protein